MKNKFLLLGATALLSTAFAMNANATNPTDDMNVDVEIIVPARFVVAEHLNFGRWVIPDNTTQITLSMASDGTITPSISGATKTGDSQIGITMGAPCETLSFPNAVYLSFGDNHPESLEYGQVKLNNLNAYSYQSESDGYSWFMCSIYGDLTVGDGVNGVNSSQYSASFTITAVLDPTTSQNP